MASLTARRRSDQSHPQPPGVGGVTELHVATSARHRLSSQCAMIACDSAPTRRLILTERRKPWVTIESLAAHLDALRCS